MLKENIKTEYEILSVPEDLQLVRSIRPIFLEKAKKICEFLTYNTKSPAFWHNNIDGNEIEIYTKSSNAKYARKFLEEFEHDYMSILRKREMIIKYRHKKD